MTRYNYSCVSKSGLNIIGVIDYRPKMFDRDELTNRVMSEVAKVAQGYKTVWDPFNIELIVRAQKEPKP